MTYRNAKKLHTGDEIELKATGEIARIVEVYIDEEHKTVLAMTDDGNWHRHKTFK